MSTSPTEPTHLHSFVEVSRQSSKVTVRSGCGIERTFTMERGERLSDHGFVAWFSQTTCPDCLSRLKRQE